MNTVILNDLLFFKEDLNTNISNFISNFISDKNISDQNITDQNISYQNLTLVHNNIQIPILIKKSQNNIYTMEYYNPNVYSSRSFIIIFADYFTNELNNNCYISSINEDNIISLKDMIKIIILFCKKLNVENIYLSDSESYMCISESDRSELLDISLYRLLTSDICIYEKLGFKIDKSNILDHLYISDLSNLSDYETILRKSLKNVYNMKIADMLDKYQQLLNILRAVKKANSYIELKLYMLDNYNNDIKQTTKILDQRYVRSEVASLLLLYKEITDIFKLTEKQTFGEFLVEAYNIEPKKYIIIEKYILNPHKIVGIEYNDQIIWFDFFNDLIKISLTKRIVKKLSLKNKSFLPKRMKRSKPRRQLKKQTGGNHYISFINEYLDYMSLNLKPT